VTLKKYRSKDEVANWQGEDPIEKVLQTILDNKMATPKQIEEINQNVLKVVEESVKFAEESPLPEPHELFEDVYSDEYPYIKEFIE
jgi:pyruvate dehydrogenase E1 component alpha subunit